MALPKFCKYCQFFHPLTEPGYGDRWGVCDNPVVEARIKVETLEAKPTVSGLFVEQHFGCIHFQYTHGNIVAKIDPFEESD